MSTVNISACPICGDDSPRAIDAMRGYSTVVEGTGVCGACAERVANAYWMKHGGRWLTWPNEPAPKPAKVPINPVLRAEVFKRDGYRCLRCGCSSREELRADHVVPESRGGSATLENLQTLCMTCNSWKGVKTIDFRPQPRGAV